MPKVSQSISLDELSWPSSRIAEAMTSLARHLGHSPAARDALELSHTFKDDELDQAIVSTAEWLGLEAEPVEATYPDLNQFLAGSGPALLQLPGESPPRFLVLVRGARKSVEVIGPDLDTHRLPFEQLENAMVFNAETSVGESVDQLLDQAGVDPTRHSKARTVMLRERLAEVVIGGCWLLRLPARAGAWEQARAARLPRYLLGFCATHTLGGFLGLASWWVLGGAALNGRLDRGWLLAWALLLVTLIPFQLLALWYQGGCSLSRRALY